MAKIIAVVPSMRGVIAVGEDGSAWYLVDPYFDSSRNSERAWVRLPSVPGVG